MAYSAQKLLIATRRLPVTISKQKKNWHLTAGASGILAAIEPFLKSTEGTWVGWPGCGREVPAVPLLQNYSATLGYTFAPVRLSDEEIKQFHPGLTDQVLWPLFHNLPEDTHYREEFWERYVAENERYAEEIMRLMEPSSFVWIHDSALLLIAYFLRPRMTRRPLHFSLHCPFPPRPQFSQLPWREEIITAMLEYDYLGFQTLEDRRNFVQCVKAFQPEAIIKIFKRLSYVLLRDRRIELGHYPTGIDFEALSSQSDTTAVGDISRRIRTRYGRKKLLLAVDRNNRAAGLIERLHAFECFLKKYPDQSGHVCLLQIVEPAVSNDDAARMRMGHVTRELNRINSEYGNDKWTPIRLEESHLNRTTLLGHLRAADVGLMTPLRAGMHLAAKEYCAATVDRNGVLILSEFAGARAQLAKGALIVNPYDFEGTADAIYAATVMSVEEREKRMKLLRAEVKRNDSQKWIDWLLGSGVDLDENRPITHEDSFIS